MNVFKWVYNYTLMLCLGLQNQVTSAHKKFEISQRVIVELINMVTGENTFQPPTTSERLDRIAVRRKKLQRGQQDQVYRNCTEPSKT